MKGSADNLENVTILGIDPGLVNTGYGVISHAGGQTSLVEAGVVRTDPKEELASRLNEIYAGLGSVIKEFQPDLMASMEI
ncbi:MAG: crossover junction endodeoxyribonuclease RuvC [candidate division Zixibacteria bacterium]|nr:crossover junction endodeoxyribonuclease RuvC [candidate division Zixibacteria bacterium]